VGSVVGAARLSIGAIMIERPIATLARIYEDAIPRRMRAAVAAAAGA
jgi:hypothetical protein